MIHVMIRQTVADYAQWKQGFEGNAAEREKAGCQGGHVYRNSANENEVIVLLKWDSTENARNFFESAALRQVQQQAGVQAPSREVIYLDKAEEVRI